MATKKFITKNGILSSNLQFVDTIGNSTQSITLNMDSLGTLSFDGTNGQLFSVTDNMTGTIFAVNDVSGIPSIEVIDNGTIRLAEFSGNVLVGTSTDDGINKLQVKGKASITHTGTTGVTGTMSFKNNNDAYSGIQVLSGGVGLSMNAHNTGHGYISANSALSFTAYNATNGSTIWMGNGSRLKLTNTAGTETYAFVSTTGDVGIGTAAPAAKLDVVGNIAVSGTVDGRDIATDGAKLDGIAVNANNYVLPASVVHDTESGALHATDALRVSGTTLSLYKGDGSFESVTTQDTVYTHPTTDGNLHVPATGTTNNGKVLTAGATAGSLSWTTPATVITDHTGLTSIGTNTHAQIDTHIGDATKHRVINDASTTTTDLWSASKISTELSGKEPAFTKNTGFNKNLGTTAGTVSEGNHTHATTYLGITAKAADSNLLDGIDSTQFVRSDVDATKTGKLILNDNLVTTVPIIGRDYGNEFWMADKIGTYTPSANIIANTSVFRKGDSYSYFSDGAPAVFEVTGLSINATTNVSARRIAIFPHGSFVTDLLIEVLTASDVWTTVYNQAGITLNGSQWYFYALTGVAYPTDWNIKGIRWTFSNYGTGTNRYIGQLGITNTRDYQTFEYLGREGGNFYSSIFGRSGTTSNLELNPSTGIIYATSFTEGGTALTSKYLGISANAVSASKWLTARTLTLSGNVSGSVSFDGSGAINMTNTVVANDSHTHSNYLVTTTAPVFGTDSIVSRTANTSLTLSGNGTGSVYVNDDLNVAGNLTIQGTTTTINSTTVDVADKNITLGNVTTPTDVTADGGGITLKGATDKTIIWTSATSSWDFNQVIKENGTLLSAKYAAIGHNHTGVYEPAFSKNSGFNKNFGTLAGTVSEGNHTHTGVYEPAFAKNTAFNKNFGTLTGDVAQGDDSRINNGQTAFGWGNHASAGYLTSFTETDPVFVAHTVHGISNGTGFLKNNGTGTWSYDNSSYSLTSHNHTLDGLSNVTITANAAGEILKWNGTAWINNTLAEAGIATSGHTHTGVYEPVFTKNTGFNKNFGTTTGTVAQGDDSRIVNGQTAFSWGNHASAGYLTSANVIDTFLSTSATDALSAGRGKVLYDEHNSHINATNPHNITKTTVGLGNVDNTSDLNKPISTATQTALDAKVSLVTTSGVDVNTIVTAGLYDVSISTNYPGTRVAYMLLVMRRSGATVVYQQLTAEDEMYIRKSTDGGTNWSTWIKVVTINGANIWSAQQTFLETKETVYNLSGTVIDPANGTLQHMVLGQNTTFTESLESGQSVVLRLVNGSTYTVTFPTMTWVTSAGNVMPTLTANDVIVLWKENTTLFGAYVGSAV